MRRLAAALALATLAAGCSMGSDPSVVSGDATTASVAASTSTTAASTTTTTTTTTTTAPAAARPAATGAPAGAGTLGEGDPASVAAALAASEAAIRDPGTPAGDLERQGRAQQVAYRQLAARPEWLPQVLDRVPASLHATVRANGMAGTELRALTRLRADLPPWRIVDPAPPEALLAYYKAAEARVGVPWNYLAAIHLVETRMGRIRGVSTAGAQGPMQFLPATWAQYGGGGDVNSDSDAILAAARLLARNGAPGDMAKALFSYNRSQHYVNAVTAYAGQMGTSERAYFGYYHWQVYYRMPDGDHLLAVGYGT